LGLRLMAAGGIPELLQREARHVESLPPQARRLLEAEVSIRAGGEIEALAVLHRPFDGPINPFYVQYQVMRLAELGAGPEAQLRLNAQGPLMGEFEHHYAQVRISRIVGDRVLAQASFRTLLRLPLNPSRVERLAGLLVMHPDESSFRALHVRLHADPAFSATLDGASLWLAGTLSGAAEEAAFWQAHGRQSLRAYPTITRLNFSSWDLLEPNTAMNLVNTLPLPREVILALLTRMTPQPTRAAAPALTRPVPVGQ
jgi:hypothetical protein